jgi:hypothetical protein
MDGENSRQKITVDHPEAIRILENRKNPRLWNPSANPDGLRNLKLPRMFEVLLLPRGGELVRSDFLIAAQVFSIVKDAAVAQG